SGLENRQGCKPLVGSNPTPSATRHPPTRQAAPADDESCFRRRRRLRRTSPTAVDPIGVARPVLSVVVPHHAAGIFYAFGAWACCCLPVLDRPLESGAFGGRADIIDRYVVGCQ